MLNSALRFLVLPLALVLSWGALLPGLAALAATPTESAAPQIETTYPVPREARHPDRTVENLPGGAVALLAYSGDGRVLASAGADQVVRVWNARTGEEGTGELLRTLTGAPLRPTGLGFRGNATVLALAGRTVSSWDAATGKLLGKVSLKTAPQLAALSPGEAPRLAGAIGNRVGLWNLENGEEQKSFALEDGRPRCLAFQADGKVLAAGTDKGAVRFWDVETGGLLRTVQAGKGLRSCAISASHLVAGLADGTVAVWALTSPEPTFVLEAHKGVVTNVALDKKSEQLASAGADGVINIWHVETGKLLCAQEGHKGEVAAVLFNPNGQKMASAGKDRTLRTWTVPLPPIPPADLDKLSGAVPDKAAAAPKKARKLLVFWRADAILHKSGVPAANKAIELMGKKTGAFEAYFSRDTDVFHPKVLSRYDAIVFNSTAHLVLDDEAKRQALLDYVRGGGGVIGIHAAIDMFKRWPEGAKIIGATFAGHPWPPSGTWSVKLALPDHPLLRAFGKKDFPMHDEFYELGEPYTRADRRVLLTLDNADPKTLAVTPLHRADKDFAVSWIKRYGEGRVFYAMFGHIGEPFQNPAVQQFYLDGIQYALGDLDADATPEVAGAGASKPPAAP